MKKSVLVLFVLAFWAVGSVRAQEAKIGYTNAEAVLASLNEFKVVKSDLEAYQKQIETQMQSKYSEYQQKAESLQKVMNDISELVKQDKIKELQTLEKNIQDFEAQAKADMQKKQNDMLSPLYEKIQKAIDEVSKADNLTFVFSSGTAGLPILLYAKEEFDITNKVIAKLGGKLISKDEKPAPTETKKTGQ
jgi:outer membrane protein